MKPLTEAECIERDNVMRETLRHLKEEAALRREIERRAACYDDLLAACEMLYEFVSSSRVLVPDSDYHRVTAAAAAIAKAKGTDNAQ